MVVTRKGLALLGNFNVKFLKESIMSDNPIGSGIVTSCYPIQDPSGETPRSAYCDNWVESVSKGSNTPVLMAIVDNKAAVIIPIENVAGIVLCSKSATIGSHVTIIE